MPVRSTCMGPETRTLMESASSRGMRIGTDGLGPVQKLAEEGKTSEEQEELPLATSQPLPGRGLASFQSPHQIVDSTMSNGGDFAFELRPPGQS